MRKGARELAAAARHQEAILEIVDGIIAKVKAAIEIGLPMDGLANPSETIAKFAAVNRAYEAGAFDEDAA